MVYKNQYSRLSKLLWMSTSSIETTNRSRKRIIKNMTQEIGINDKVL